MERRGMASRFDRPNEGGKMSAERLTPDEARSALSDVQHARRAVVEEIGLPAWYLWGLALGWIGVGYVADLDRPWLSAVVTLVFGAAHAAAFGRVRSGRHRSDRVSVRKRAGMRHTSLLVFGSLLVLIGITIAGALLAGADGARHPATMASVLAAVCILLGGPAAMGWLSRSVLRQEAA
jgi:hypothetical protein